ncbi:hypothetical protein BDN72DRAFT_845243 [Pluteus cervinus]|uniref:Uncharacterized protein n=1 Tax=Pluteus cervinus TaxID=181527 RepID=A0ACD3AIJ1_9AGAR|nr:hypothetical protein BDN72DRAFT_845243 [Pluteus cervinus]
MSNISSGNNPIPNFCISTLNHAEAFLEIDSKISQLETQLRYLRSLRNTLPPISSLSNEILSQIFLEAHILDTGSNYDFGRLDEELTDSLGKTRLVLSWVSGHWRSVALSDQHLWSFITDGIPEYTNACIVRSRGLDLSFKLSSGQLLQTCLEQSHRLGSLSGDFFNIPSEDLTPLYDSTWVNPAGRLHSLSLRNIDLFDGGEAPTLFGGVYPQLRRFSIAGSWFDWGSILPSASTITTLYVYYPEIRISAPNLAEILGTLPALTDCKFDHCIDEDPVDEARRRITLPSLRNIILRDLFFNYPLLQHLDIPHASVHVVVENRMPDRTGFKPLFQQLESYQGETPGWAKHEIRHISLDCIGKVSTFTISTSPVELSSELVCSSPVQSGSRTFTLEIPTHRPPVGDVGVMLFDHPPFTGNSLQSAFLNGISRNAVYCFAHAENLRVLKLSSITRGAELGTCLSKNKVKAFVPGSLEGSFPSVEELEVDGVRYPSFGVFHSFSMTN